MVMNRRSFLKLAGVGALTIPFLKRKRKKNMTIQIHSFSTINYASGFDSGSWNHGDTTDTAGKYAALVVGVSIFGTETVSSIKDDGGQDFIFVRADTNGSYRSEIWYLPNFTANGDTPIQVFLTGVADFVAGACCYLYFGGVGSNNGATGTTTPTAEVIMLNNNINSILFSNFCINSPSGSAPAGIDALRWNVFDDPSDNSGLAADYGPLVTAAYTPTYQTAAPATWALSAVELVNYQDNPPAIMGSGM